MTEFSNVPAEIWLLIVAEFSSFDLYGLRSLNSFFFNCWMDRRWKHIRVFLPVDDQSLRILKRVEDPFVASRVKSLTLRLGRLQLTLNSPKTQIEESDFLPLLHCLNLLPNIASLSISVNRGTASHVLATFFQTITHSSLATTLQHLSLSGNLETFAWLWEYSARNIPFGNLTKLEFDIVTSHTDPSVTLAPFFRSVSPTLQTLSIKGSSHILSLFIDDHFRILSKNSPVFPNLKSLLISVFSFRSSLHHFLLTHNNLHHLDLNIRDENQDLWFSALVNHNYQLPSLQSLRIFTTTTQVGISALLTLIKRTARTLFSLTITGQCLPLADAEKVVYALTEDGATSVTPEQPSKLKNLNMPVYKISVPFFDLLAQKLPQLEKLALRATKINGSRQGPFCDDLHLRRYDPNNVTCNQDVLHTWKLNDLSIEMGCGNQSQADQSQADRALQSVAGAVPALAHAMSRKVEYS